MAHANRPLPVKSGLYEVSGILENFLLALVFRKDRVEHELLRPVMPIHLDRCFVYEANSPPAVLIQLVPSDVKGLANPSGDTVSVPA